MSLFNYLLILVSSFLPVPAAMPAGTGVPEQTRSDSLPAFMQGNFKDDYGISYEITNTVWTQFPKTRYHILFVNTKEQYLIARNDSLNGSDRGLYTRIDYMRFQNMEPYRWGYCLTAYQAASEADARQTAAADRNNPRKGCNGFPFSRMSAIRGKK